MEKQYCVLEHQLLNAVGSAGSGFRGVSTYRWDRLFCYSCHCHRPFRYTSFHRAEVPDCCTHACDFSLLRHTLLNTLPKETTVPSHHPLEENTMISDTPSQKIPEAERESRVLKVDISRQSEGRSAQITERGGGVEQGLRRFQLYWRVQVGHAHRDTGRHGRTGSLSHCRRSPCLPAGAQERYSGVFW